MSSTHSSYTLKIGVSVHGVVGAEFLISHTFQCKRYISTASTGNFIMYALGPFSRKRSHMISVIAAGIHNVIS